MIDTYRKHLEARLLAPSTVRCHMATLGRFTRWLGELDLRDVTLQTLLDYHGQLATCRNAPGVPTSVQHRNSQMWVIIAFFAFLHERGKILVNPAADFPVLRKPKRLPRGVLTNAQVMRLLAQPDTQTAIGFRDRTVMELLYSCGLRGLEVCRLTIYDADLKAHTVRINQGKGKKDRIVPLGKVAAGYVCEYLANVRPILLARGQGNRRPVDRLFLNGHGGPLNTDILRRIVRRSAKAAGLGQTVSTHGFRHACATEMLRGGASVRHVQELLGHACLTTTQLYTRVAPVDLQRVHRATSPSERRKNMAVPLFVLKGFRDKKNKRPAH